MLFCNSKFRSYDTSTIYLKSDRAGDRIPMGIIDCAQSICPVEESVLSGLNLIDFLSLPFLFTIPSAILRNTAHRKTPLREYPRRGGS